MPLYDDIKYGTCELCSAMGTIHGHGDNKYYLCDDCQDRALNRGFVYRGEYDRKEE